MKPTAGVGRKQITNQGQTAQSQHAANPQATVKGKSEPRDLTLNTKSE